MTGLERLRTWALLSHPHSLLEELNLFGEKRCRAARFWAVLVVMLCFGEVLAHLWVFEYAGLWSGDALLRLRPPEVAKRVGVVTVTQEERTKLLGGIVPIPKDNLLRAVCSILRVQPAQLGVDLATADVRLEVLPKQPIAWARGIRIVREGQVIRVEQEPVLGGKHPQALSGLAVAPVRPDWSAREIHGCYEFEKGRAMRTMVGVLAVSAGSRFGASCENEQGKREEREEASAYDVNYQFERFTLADFAPDQLTTEDLKQCVAGAGDWDPASGSAVAARGKRGLFQRTGTGVQPSTLQ